MRQEPAAAAPAPQRRRQSNDQPRQWQKCKRADDEPVGNPKVARGHGDTRPLVIDIDRLPIASLRVGLYLGTRQALPTDPPPRRTAAATGPSGS